MLNKSMRNKLLNDRAMRIATSARSHQLFFALYFASYMKYEISDLHRQLFLLTEQKDTPLSVVMAFRGSAKTTIMTTSYPIWAIVSGKKKFVVIASQTTTKRESTSPILNES